MIDFYVIRKSNGTFWTGLPNDFSHEMFNAKIFSEIEMEVSFVHSDEEWVPLHYKGAA